MVSVLNALTSALTVDSNMTNSEVESLARQLGGLGSSRRHLRHRRHADGARQARREPGDRQSALDGDQGQQPQGLRREVSVDRDAPGRAVTRSRSPAGDPFGARPCDYLSAGSYAISPARTGARDIARPCFTQDQATTRTSSVPRGPAVLPRWPGLFRGPSGDGGSAAARSGACSRQQATGLVPGHHVSACQVNVVVPPANRWHRWPQVYRP